MDSPLYPRDTLRTPDPQSHRRKRLAALFYFLRWKRDFPTVRPRSTQWCIDVILADFERYDL